MWLIRRNFQLEQVPSLAVFFAYSARASGWRWYSPQWLDLGDFGEVVAMRDARDRDGRRHQRSFRPQMTAISESIGLRCGCLGTPEGLDRIIADHRFRSSAESPAADTVTSWRSGPKSLSTASTAKPTTFRSAPETCRRSQSAASSK
jgi:hypothetical protein